MISTADGRRTSGVGLLMVMVGMEAGTGTRGRVEVVEAMVEDASSCGEVWARCRAPIRGCDPVGDSELEVLLFNVGRLDSVWLLFCFRIGLGPEKLGMDGGDPACAFGGDGNRLNLEPSARCTGITVAL